MKAIRIPEDLWKRLSNRRDATIIEAEKSGDELRTTAIKALSVAAFGRYLIEKGLKEEDNATRD